MNDIEIKVGQKYRVLTPSLFAGTSDGQVLTVRGFDDDGDAFCDDTHGKSLSLFPCDIGDGDVELISEPFDSITTQIPPVGTKCLYSFNKEHWFKCEVIAQDRPVIYCPHLDDFDGGENGLQVLDEDDGITVFFKPSPEENPEPATQIRMEEIEKQMRELADELQDLKEDL